MTMHNIGRDKKSMKRYFFDVRLKSSLIILLSLFCQACAGEKEYAYLEDGSNWHIYATAPYYYDVYIERINGINETQDWVTSHLQLNRSDDSKKERIAYAKYKNWAFDPFGLDLYGNYVNSGQAIQSKVNAPERVFIAWLSLAEGQFYQMVYYLSAEVRAKILHGNLHKNQGGLDCSSRLTFGFIPGGEVNVWLSVCHQYTFLERVKAQVGPLDESYYGEGHQSRLYPALIRRQKEKAQADGVSLFPIPPERLAHMRNSNTAPGSPVTLTKTVPLKRTHCWAEKPYNLDIKLDKGSPQFSLSRKLWINVDDFARKVRRLDTGIHLAWIEAEDKGFTGRERELWILARLSAQGQVPVANIAAKAGAECGRSKTSAIVGR